MNGNESGNKPEDEGEEVRHPPECSPPKTKAESADPTSTPGIDESHPSNVGEGLASSGTTAYKPGQEETGETSGVESVVHAEESVSHPRDDTDKTSRPQDTPDEQDRQDEQLAVPPEGATEGGTGASVDSSASRPTPPVQALGEPPPRLTFQFNPDFLAPTPNPINRYMLQPNAPRTAKMSSKSPDYWASLVHNASFLDSKGLYRAYQLDLLRRSPVKIPGPPGERWNPDPSEKGSDLIRAIAEYVSAVEVNMTSLHMALKQERSGKGNTDKESESSSAPNPEKKTPASPWIDLKLETRFYTCDGLFDSDGDFKHACAEEMAAALPTPGPPGSAFNNNKPPLPYDKLPHPSHSNYMCKSDPQYLIRVLYDDRDGAAGQGPQHGKRPSADQIDIIGFMVASEPISDFFEKRLGLDAGVSRVLKFAKPFRSVLRNLEHLREHLSSLGAKYNRSLDGDSERREPADNDVPEAGSSQQSDDRKPSPPPTGKAQEKEESYERPEAFDHFRHLVQFLDQYLAVKASLFQALREGTREKVSYEDLWMLFETGDKIYSPFRQGRTVIRNETSGSDSGSDSGSESESDDDVHITRRRYAPQAYRVVATTGGSPLRRSWAPKDVEMDSEYLPNDSLLQFFIGRAARTAGIRTQQADSQPRQRMKERYSSLHVLCIYVDFDGLRYGTETDIFLFKPFDGEISVRSLEAYPLQYFVSPRADYLLQRGRKFVDVTASSKHMTHTGFTVGENKEEVHSAAVVDLKLACTEYQKEFPEQDAVIPTFKPFGKFWPEVGAELSDCSVWARIPCPHGPYCHGYSCVEDLYRTSQKNQLEKIEPKIQEVLEEFDFLPQEEGNIDRFKSYLEEQDLIELLPGVVPGFALRNRAWVQLNLDQLDFVEKEDEWKKLTLPKGHKQIVQAMVETHSSGSHNSADDDIDKIEMDLVRGKGKGCIILLHGVPGVGKTSTAECVASYTQRPLYSITCGDVGYEPEDVERNMGRHFKLAHRWGCVLLLDEADVFLAKRNKTDVKRNGLVSSFLRILEYYSGILFLTTNRVGAIDDAFRSRLHLTLYYPKLTRKQTLRIWKTNLQRLEDINTERQDTNRQPIKFNPKKIAKWVSTHWEEMQWNGRQIRNAFQTAVALAEFKAKQASAKHPGSPKVPPSLDIEQFKLLAIASKQFSDYLHLTHGDDEDERAVLDKVRAVPRPSRNKSNNFGDEDEDDDDDDDDDGDDSMLDSDSKTGEGSSSGSNDDSDTVSESNSSEIISKAKKKAKKSGKGKAKAVKDERREKSKGRKKDI